MRQRRQSKARRKAQIMVGAAIVFTVSFFAGALTEHFSDQRDTFKCAAVQIFGNDSTYGEPSEDGSSLTIHNPTEVRCFATPVPTPRKLHTER